MKTLLAIPAGLFFFFMPAIVAYYSWFAPDPIKSAALVIVISGILFFVGFGVLKEAEIGFGAKATLETIMVLAYLPYIYCISYNYGNTSLNVPVFVMYTLFVAVLSIKLFSIVSPDLFEYAASDTKNRFIKISIGAIGLHAFWLFFWFRVLNLIYLPLELSVFIGTILLLVSVLSWFFIRDFHHSLDQISSTVYFSFYAISAIGLTVFVIKWIEEPSFLFPNAVDMTIGQNILNFLFAAFWVIYCIYSYKASNALEKNYATHITE